MPVIKATTLVVVLIYVPIQSMYVWFFKFQIFFFDLSTTYMSRLWAEITIFHEVRTIVCCFSCVCKHMSKRVLSLLNGFKRNLWLTHDSLVYPNLLNYFPFRMTRVQTEWVELAKTWFLTWISNEQFNLWSVQKT